VNRGKELNNILDECLERLLVQGETVERCLESYPEHATKLEPLLRTAVAANEALAIQPHPEFKARARYQLDLVLEKVKPKRRLPVLGWQPRWAVVMVVFLAVVLLTGGSTALAADHIMPGNPLYPVKLATEQVRLVLTFSDIGKAELYATLADRRVAEITYMVDKGKPRHVEPTAQRLNNHLAMMTSLPLAEGAERRGSSVPAPPPVPPGRAEMDSRGVHAQANGRARLRTLLGGYVVNHPAKLRAVLERAPESAKPALLRAIAISETGYQKAIEDLD